MRQRGGRVHFFVSNFRFQVSDFLSLKPDAADMDGFVFEFTDHGLEKVGGITEWLEPVLACNGGEVAGGSGFHGGDLIEVFGGRTREAEVLAVGYEQSAGLLGEQIAEVNLDVEAAEARGIKMIN